MILLALLLPLLLLIRPFHVTSSPDALRGPLPELLLLLLLLLLLASSSCCCSSCRPYYLAQHSGLLPSLLYLATGLALLQYSYTQLVIITWQNGGLLFTVFLAKLGRNSQFWVGRDM